MRRRSRLAAAAMLATGACLAAAAPASAATDPDAVYVFLRSTDAGVTTLSFGTAAKADASLSTLSVEYTGVEPKAIEIVDEFGYAIVPGWVGPDFVTSIARWDTTTGEVISSTPIVLDSGSPLYRPDWVGGSFIGLDSPDGVHLQTAVCAWGMTGRECFLGTLDPTTAVFTATADLTTVSATSGSTMGDLATAPATGTTTLFFDVYDPQAGSRMPFAVTLQDGVLGTPFPLTGVTTTVGGGAVLGADYAPDGTLWLVYSGAGGLELLSFAAGASLTDAVPTEVGPLETGDPAGPLVTADAFGQLAVAPWVPATPAAPDDDPPTAPALAETGAASVGAAALGASLLLAGALTLGMRRRRNA
jgi:LPXTG-motif cell wall-anchored protein